MDANANGSQNGQSRSAPALPPTRRPADFAPDHALEPLTPAESLALLTQEEIGRVVFTDEALPAVTPVNYVVDGHSVVFRTSAHSRLARAAAGNVVAFEVDAYDRISRSGWSVVLVGVASVLRTRSEQLRATELGLATWAGGDRSLFVRVTPGRVTGRRIGTIVG